MTELIAKRPLAEGYREDREFETRIHKADDTTENRESVLGDSRKPLRSVSMSLQHWERSTVQRLLNTFRDALESDVYVPLWFSETVLTSATTGSSTINCDTSNREFTEGEKLAIIASDSSWEIATIQTINASSIATTSPVSSGFDAGTVVCPVILAIPAGDYSGGFTSERLGRDSITFEEFR